MRNRLAAAATVLLGTTVLAGADPVPRETPVAGSVIARKSGEEARFIEVGSFQTVDVRQDLRPGDVLRTNASGNLAILFSDRTQVRLGRNSTMVVKSIGGTGEDTQLALESGELWARAERGGDGVAVQTPGATAAIRGTDWSMQVNGDQTTLTVLEGEVNFSNPQGSIALKAGEAASVLIGQAPTRLANVNPNDREQTLYYYSLRNAFNFLPASDLTPAELRAERARIQAIPEAQRSTADRITLAEAALTLDGRAATLAAVASARAGSPNRAENARLQLVEGIVAGASRRDVEAARLFEQAAPVLSGPRRAVALYGGYFARALGEPDRQETPPDPADGGAPGAAAEAFTQSFLDGVPAAIRILRGAQARFPDDPTLPAIRAQFAILLDDRAQAQEAADRALAIDPADASALEASALVRANRSDLEGAFADISRATAAAPGSASVLGNLADVQSARGATREAEAAYRLSIENDPENPVTRANYAIFLLDGDRLEEAKVQIDRAIAADPNLDVVLTARGRYRLQTGEFDLALQDLLASSTANPAYAQGLLALAAGYYESGDRVGAQQALDNADRLDANDPVIPTFRTSIAIDEYDSDLAIASAQEALRRARARGGDFAALSANRDEGSTLNQAFSLQGLNAWGRYYADATYDPFSATSLTDQAVAGSPNPFFTDLDFGGTALEPTLNNNTFAGFFQGLLLDPALLASRELSANLIRRPFFEGSVGGGFVAPDSGDVGWTTQLEARGFAASPFPVSFFANFTGRDSTDFREGVRENGLLTTDLSFNLEDEDFSGTAYLAAKPTPDDRIVAYIDARSDNDNVLDAQSDFQPGVLDLDLLPLFIDDATYNRDIRDRSLTAGLAASHTFAFENIVNAGLFVSGFKRSSQEAGMFGLGLLGAPGVRFNATTDVDGAYDQSVVTAAVNHMVGFGDLKLRYGVEGGQVSQSQDERNAIGLIDVPPTVGGFVDGSPIVSGSSYDSTFLAGRAYLDAFYEISPTLKAEAGLFGTIIGNEDTTASTINAGTVTQVVPETDDLRRLEPRVGLAWEVFPGQLLRAGYLREPGAFSAASLAPSGVVGLQSNQLPLSIVGFSDTVAVRWDAEWTNRFFTSLDFQHQEFDGLSIPIPEGISTASVSEGRLDRFSATANLHLDGGFGLFATVAHASSITGVEDVATGALPYVPKLSARTGLTFVSPENIKVTVAETYVGERPGSLGGSKVGDYFTTDAFLTWEPLDKRFELELAGYNLFDEDFDVSTNTPGWSRTFTGSLKVRF